MHPDLATAPTAALSAGRTGRPTGAVAVVLVACVVTAAAAALLVLPVFPAELVEFSRIEPYPGRAAPTPDLFGAVYLWGVAVCLPCGALIYIGGRVLGGRLVADDERRQRVRRTAGWVALAVATGTPAIPLVLIAIPNPPGLMLAVPGAAYAIWVLHRVQRHRRLPLRLSLAAFGWGATFGMSMGLLLQVLQSEVLILANHANLVRLLQGGSVDGWFNALLTEPLLAELAAPLHEELAKALGVVVVFSLCRRRYDGVVHGIVIGAMVGAGFNFIETVRFAHTYFDSAMYQIWVRQWVAGFFFGHVLFTALFGAALALAAETARRLVKVLAVVGGFAVAVSGHLLWNHLTGTGGLPWASDHPLVQLYVAMPANYLTVSGPFLLVVVVLFVLGLRREAHALRAALPVESMTGFGAITADEADVLGHPRLRLRRRVAALLAAGPVASLRVGRLHAAQLDLAMARWRLAHGHTPAVGEDDLRRLVDRRRAASTRSLDPGRS